MATQTCKFYLQGRCKYGDRCWYQHVDPHSSPARYNQNQSSSPFHYYSKPEQANTNTYRNDTSRWSRDDVSQLLHLAREAAEQVELCKMWPLTCLSVMKMKGSLPGWTDYSMEELRFGAYAATKVERFPQYQQVVQAVYSKAQNARHVLLKGGREAENLIVSYLQSSDSGVQSPGPVSNVFFTTFSFDASNSPQSMSDPAPGLFARAPPRPESSGQPSPAMSSINFGAVAQSARPVSPPAASGSFSFASVPQKPQNSSPFPVTPSIFSQPASQPPAFSSPSSGFPLSSPSQQSTSVSTPSFQSFSFSAAPSESAISSQMVTSGIYCHIQDLTDKELEQYRAPTFTLGRIPVKPPPKELC